MQNCTSCQLFWFGYLHLNDSLLIRSLLSLILVRTILHNFYFWSFSLLLFLVHLVFVFLQLKKNSVLVKWMVIIFVFVFTSVMKTALWLLTCDNWQQLTTLTACCQYETSNHQFVYSVCVYLTKVEVGCASRVMSNLSNTPTNPALSKREPASTRLNLPTTLCLPGGTQCLPGGTQCLPGGTQMPGNVRRWAARRVSNSRPSLDSRINAQPTSTPRSLVASDNRDVNDGVRLWIGQNAGLCHINTVNITIY